MKNSNTQCEHCGKAIYKKPFQIKRYKTHFCDIGCLSAHNSKDVEEAECDNCGDLIRLTAAKKRRSRTGLHFCGNLCKNRYISRNRKDRYHGRMSTANPISHRGRIDLVRASANWICQMCGYGDDSRLLDVHHIDGNHQNNVMINLTCLCVMCHAVLHRTGIAVSLPPLFEDQMHIDAMIFAYHTGKYDEALRRQEDRNVEHETQSVCQSCGSAFKSKKRYRRKYCSVECADNGRRHVERPAKEELEKMVRTMSWSAIGRRFKVSDNAVRKWARSYGITWEKRPYRKTTIGA